MVLLWCRSSKVIVGVQGGIQNLDKGELSVTADLREILLILTKSVKRRVLHKFDIHSHEFILFIFNRYRYMSVNVWNLIYRWTFFHAQKIIRSSRLEAYCRAYKFNQALQKVNNIPMVIAIGQKTTPVSSRDAESRTKCFSIITTWIGVD